MATIQNVYTSNKVSFSYYNYNKGIFFDEKKKRFVDFADMDQISYMNYKRPFKWVRTYKYTYLHIVQTRLLRREECLPRQGSLRPCQCILGVHAQDENAGVRQNVYFVQKKLPPLHAASL